VRHWGGKTAGQYFFQNVESVAWRETEGLGVGEAKYHVLACLADVFDGRKGASRKGRLT
jgi:hypothetical protein